MLEVRGALFCAAVVSLFALGAQSAALGDDVGTGSRISIQSADDTVITVDGMRVHGGIELMADGTVINEVPFERYVAGVAEMPSRWPMEALKAQAVAARTYAWWSARNARHENADICATTACQVYRGAQVVEDGGEQWARAVRETSGEVLLDESGEPILARYFSTSGGRTYANEDVFPSTGVQPGLEAIDDPYDEVSPYHRWEVRFTSAELDELLARGERLAAAVPVADVSRIGGIDEHGARIAVTGGDGTVVEVGAVELRDFLSLVAPDSFPDRFPPPRADGWADLPSTVPSSRFSVRMSGDEVVFAGRGWGHGVGLGQYGARGRARDGASYAQILAAYYAGITPTVTDELPATIRVTLRSTDVVGIRSQAAFSISADGAPVTEHALGTWSFEHDGDMWRIDAPDTHDAALEVGETRVVSGLDDRRAPLIVQARVNKPAELRLEVSDAGGDVVFTRELGVADPGTHAAAWTYEDDTGSPVAPGAFDLAIVANDADGSAAGDPATVMVGEASGTGNGSVLPSTRSLLGALAGTLAVGAVLVVVRKARA